jgi:nucleoside-diphosphate-sugar epimerase
MRVVVTGASGNVGTAVVEALSRREEITEVVGVCRRPHEWRPSKTSWVWADVVTDDLAPVFGGADAVIHLAWLFHPSRRPDRTWTANTGGAAAVLDAVAAADVPVVTVASSVGAYSPRASLTPVDETWPTAGCARAPYSREKAYVERLMDVHEATHPHRRVVRMRPGFIFQRGAAVEQRRLFLGPLVPDRLLRPGRLPVLPVPRGLVLPMVHSADVADAYVASVLRPVTGPFNLMAEPPLGTEALGDVLGTRTVEVSPAVMRGALVAAFHARGVPVHPGMFDLALQVPMMRTQRARDVLGWMPQHTAGEALGAFLAGVTTDGRPTPPLDRGSSGPLRLRDFVTGLGQRD